jgi:hypothetical protein
MNYDLMTLNEISKATGIRPSALQSRIYRRGMTKTEAVNWKNTGNKKLAQVLEDWHNFDIEIACRYSRVSLR